MTLRDLHVGITPWRLGANLDAESLCSQARKAETWGFDSFWLPESHFAGRTSLPEPMMLLAAIAGATTRIGLGTTSYLLPIRHPLIAAEQVAVLDQLSKGRVILGLGRGYQAEMLKAFGVAPASKRDLFRQVYDTMLLAWQGEAVDGVKIAPLPVQQPHPPLWVAALGPKAIQQVGGLGLPYIASPFESPEQLDANYQLLRKAGGDLTQVPIMRFVFASEDEHRCQQVRQTLVRFQRPSQTTTDSAGVDTWASIGTPEQVQQHIQQYVERFGMTHLLITQLRLADVPPQWCEESAQAIAGLRKG